MTGLREKGDLALVLREDAQPSPSAGVRWNLVMSPVIIVGNLLLIPLSLHVAGVHAYGVWAVCSSVVVLITQLDLGVGTALVALLPRDRGHAEAGALAAGGALVCTGLALASPPVVAVALYVYFDRVQVPVDLHLVIATTCCLLVVSVLGRYLVALTQSAGAFGVERLSSVGGLVLRGGVISVGAWLGGDLVWVLIGDSLAVVTVAVVCGVWVLRRGGLPSGVGLRASSRSARQLIVFGVPAFVSSFSTSTMIQVPLYVTGAVLGLGDAAAVGAVTRLLQTWRTALGWISGPYLPSVSASMASGVTDAARTAHLRLLSVTTAAGSVAMSVLLVVPDAVMGAWLGEPGLDFGPLLAVSAPFFLVHALYAPGVVLAAAADRPGVVAVSNVVSLAVVVPLAWLLAHPWGAAGAMAGLVAPWVLALPLNLSRAAAVTGTPLPRVLLELAVVSSACVCAAVLLRLLLGLQELPVHADIAAVTSAAATTAFLTRRGIHARGHRRPPARSWGQAC